MAAEHKVCNVDICNLAQRWTAAMGQNCSWKIATGVSARAPNRSGCPHCREPARSQIRTVRKPDFRASGKIDILHFHARFVRGIRLTRRAESLPPEAIPKGTP